MNTANKLTMLRVILIPVFLVVLYLDVPFHMLYALIIFILASVTDFVDGYVARHYNQVSDFGKFLDPLADKLLICAVLIMLVDLGWAPAWVVIIIVSRELVITGLRTIAIDEGIVMAADRYGKLKTVLQIAAILPLLIHYPLLGIDMHFWGTIILYLSMIMAIVSCINYFRQFWVEFQKLHAAK